jgi:pimeloyl-ACP methyl ester carboxylesterase
MVQDDGVWIASCCDAEIEESENFSPDILLYRPDPHETVKTPRLAKAKCWNAPGDRWTWDGLECWRIACDVDTLSEQAVPAELAGRRVLIYVHGFRQKIAPVLHASRILRQYCAKSETSSEIIGFHWPAEKNITAYLSARSKTEEAAARLGSLLRCLQSNECQVRIVAHSLGARVALTALTRRESAGCEDLQLLRSIDHLVLIGAAIPRHALCEHGRFPRKYIAVSSITSFHSRCDPVLGTMYSVGESMSIPRNALYEHVTSSRKYAEVDVTTAVSSKSDPVLRTMRRRNTMYAVGHSMYRWLVIDHTPNVFEEAMGLSGIKFPLPPGCYSVDVSSSVSAHHA